MSQFKFGVRFLNVLFLELALSRSKGDLGASQESSDLSDVREHLVTTMPGDSYPAVAASLDEVDSDINTDVEELENHGNGKKQEPEYLLQKLKKGGNRMDQIKRQLVVQRGAIVAALKVLAQSRTSGSMTSFKSSEHSSASLVSEKDRVLVSITATESTSSCKLCPMCEAMFPLAAEEEFEQHVMDHFSYDSDQDTLQYYDTHETEEDLQTDHL